MKELETSSFHAEELALIRVLKHPNICQYLDFLSLDDLTYVVMELCEMDLETYLKKFMRLRADNLRMVAENLADGYLAIWRNKIVHRDLKPQNLLLKLAPNGPPLSDNIPRRHSRAMNTSLDLRRRFGRSLSGALDPLAHQPRIQDLKITDFGCSRVVLDSADSGNNLVGTFFYMAPEVGANLLDPTSYGSEIDMWSAGIVLYECMTGQLPYDEGALCKLFLRAAQKNFHGFEPPKLNTHDGPLRLREIANRLVQIDPKLRATPRHFFKFAALPEGQLPEISEESDSGENHRSLANGTNSRKTDPLHQQPWRTRVFQSVVDKCLFYGCCFCLRQKNNPGLPSS